MEINNFLEFIEEMHKYKKNMIQYLPAETTLRKLKKEGKSDDEIKNIMGRDLDILNKVPKFLYHGSVNSLDIINAKESTQAGIYVYATDNPVHALFFSIFRNSSIIRGKIKEYINEDGEYKSKYIIDERIEGVLNNIITDKIITIHVCDGEDFFKPHGPTYINREWCSKEGRNIYPIKKIDINVKHFFEYLEKENLVEYNLYNKDKNWETVLNLWSENYPFGLTTSKAKNINDFDNKYNNFINDNFPEQAEFSKYIQEDIKKIMFNTNEDRNTNLYKSKNFANSFLIKNIDENNNVQFLPNLNKINNYIDSKREEKNNIRVNN